MRADFTARHFGDYVEHRLATPALGRQASGRLPSLSLRRCHCRRVPAAAGRLPNGRTPIIRADPSQRRDGSPAQGPQQV